MILYLIANIYYLTYNIIVGNIYYIHFTQWKYICTFISYLFLEIVFCKLYLDCEFLHIFLIFVATVERKRA